MIDRINDCSEKNIKIIISQFLKVRWQASIVKLSYIDYLFCDFFK